MKPQSGEPAVFCSFGKSTSGLPRLPGARWYVAQVKSKRDKRFAHAIAASRLSYFLPMQKTKVSDGGVLRDGMVLMMPGFVFVLGHADVVHRIWETRDVWHILKTDDQFGLRADLRTLALSVKHLVFARFEAIQPGRTVRISSKYPIWSLRGREARVDLRDKNRVWIDVRMVGASSFEIDAQYLEVM